MTMRPFIFLALLGLLASCGSPDAPETDLTDRYGVPTTTSTIEPVAFTDQPYTFTGPTSIMDFVQLLSDAVPTNQRVWYGMAESYPSPYQGVCAGFNAQMNSMSTLPVELEGIVTLHPRFLQNVSICGSEERFYGSFFIQDSSGGVLVLKDSRIADFRMGDRVKLTAIGGMLNFGAYSVLAHVNHEVVSRDNPIYAEDIGDRPLTTSDVGKVVTIRRQLSSDATNYNFSELCLIVEGGNDFDCTPACSANEQCGNSVLVSLDREIEQRDPMIFKKGDILEITGPVANSFGLKILVMRAGQISIVNE